MTDHEATAKRLVEKWESEQHFLELTSAQFTRLENYIAAALAEAGKMSEEIGLSRVHELYNEIEQRDAAFVRGLERARKIVHDHLRNPTVDGWYSAIQAEIDSVGK